MHVFHISIDGLRASSISDLELIALHKIRRSGLYTDNARTDKNITITLPNHTGMFTSLPYRTYNTITKQIIGHGVYFNKDYTDMTIHELQNRYIYSIFNELYNNKKTSAMYVNKEKFNFIYKSYSQINTIKYMKNGDPCINKYYFNSKIKENNEVIPIIQELVLDINNDKLCDYNFIHFGGTDRMGHAYGWTSPQYNQALINIDYDIDYLMNVLDSKKIQYIMIITTDHGGLINKSHHDITNPLNFTIPFYIYKNGGHNLKHNDLYAFNINSRKNPPFNENPGYNGVQPIRNSDVGNLVLSLFNIGPIKNSLINFNQDLVVV